MLIIAPMFHFARGVALAQRRGRPGRLRGHRRGFQTAKFETEWGPTTPTQAGAGCAGTWGVSGQACSDGPRRQSLNR